MPDSFPTATEADITLLLEGTFPFVTGGVSSWVYQLIKFLPHYRFAIIFLGSQKKDYNGLRYPLPDNLVHLETHYLFDATRKSDDINNTTSKDKVDELSQFHQKFTHHHDDASLCKALHTELFSSKRTTREEFLYSKFSWDYILQAYFEKCPKAIFLDYFWSVRNMHMAIWKVADIVQHAPKTRVVHSISTGYAGFLGALLNQEYDYPYILTEHGIYVKERRIDLLSQWCGLGSQSEQRKSLTQDYLTDMWIRFFDVLARMAYASAAPVISLFETYREEQIKGGATIDNTLVIPNGVPVSSTFKTRQISNKEAPIIALIGRVVPIKDIKTFIKSMIIINKFLPDATAWIIGPTDEDENYFNECQELVNVLDISKQVLFLGQKNISEILPDIDLIVLSSISEGLPLVLLEGFEAGIPAVTTDVGACSELIYGNTPEDKALGEAGIIVEIANANALGEAMLELLQDNDRWLAAQKAGRERVKKYYSQKKFLQHYIQVYEKAIHTWQA